MEHRTSGVIRTQGIAGGANSQTHALGQLRHCHLVQVLEDPQPLEATEEFDERDVQLVALAMAPVQLQLCVGAEETSVKKGKVTRERRSSVSPPSHRLALFEENFVDGHELCPGAADELLNAPQLLAQFFQEKIQRRLHLKAPQRFLHHHHHHPPPPP